MSNISTEFEKSMATISRAAYPCDRRSPGRTQGGTGRSSISGSIRMSFCQLRLATERPKYVLKNGSSKRGTRGSAIHYQLDRVDVGGIVDARKSTALAISSGSPQRPCGTAEEKNFANLAESSAEAAARGPRFQMGVLIAPGATTFTRMLRGARSAAMQRAIETRPPLVAAYAATPGWPR